MASLTPLFVYGTLRGDGPAAALVGAARRERAVARGRFVTTGADYPAVKFAVDAPEVEGELVWVPETVLPRLDRYEGVPRLYRRVSVSVTTASGPVDAQAYEWNR